MARRLQFADSVTAPLRAAHLLCSCVGTAGAPVSYGAGTLSWGSHLQDGFLIPLPPHPPRSPCSEHTKRILFSLKLFLFTPPCLFHMLICPSFFTWRSSECPFNISPQCPQRAALAPSHAPTWSSHLRALWLLSSSHRSALVHEPLRAGRMAIHTCTPHT